MSEARSACCNKVLKKDNTVFREYIDNTTTHGVVRIFSNKSLVRRGFWLLIVLGAAAGCLNNCINRILFLASSPTSTSISIDRVQPLDFPAVTFCNLNFLTLDVVNATGILPLAAEVLNTVPSELGEGGACTRTLGNYPGIGDIVMEDFIYQAHHQMATFMSNCSFMGMPCFEDDFTPVLTTFGVCYTFNSGLTKPVLKSTGTGARQGLNVYLDIQQDQYISSPSIDAGARLVVRPQFEPPLPLDHGIAIPPGTNAFIGITQRNIIDETKRNCRDESEVAQFNYLRSIGYSVSACSLDCVLTQIADNCGCSYLPMQYPPDLDSRFAELPPCTFQDICCVQYEAIQPEQCDCLAACNSVQYSTFASYSQLPANYILEDLKELFGMSVEEVQNNIAGVTVFFETRNVETVTTSFSYSPVALLSDIGGQLGLFLGVSVISMMEFAMWLLDEFRDRCLCSLVSWRKKGEVTSDDEMKDFKE